MSLLRRGSLLVAAGILLVACGGGETRPASSSTPAASQSPYTGYPNSIVAIGHSLVTGYNSDPLRPTETIRSNSWATGTNPAVDSLYLKILAKNPAIKDRAVNLAKNGALVSEIQRQAVSAAGLDPKPDLAVIMIGNLDLVCPETTESKDAFLTSFVAALDTLAKGATATRIFVVSFWGSADHYADALTREERASIGGTGPCKYLDSEGRVVERKLTVYEDSVHALEAQLESGCKRYSLCRYDGGAFGSVMDERAFYAPHDVGHFSVAGNAKAAAVAWDALKRVGLIPQ